MKRVPRVMAILSTALLSAAAAGKAQQPQQPDTPSWGGTDRVLQRVGPHAFHPNNSSVTYAHDNTGIYSTVPNGTFGAPLHLPSGALLMSLRLDYCDIDATNNVLLQLLECTVPAGPCVSMGGAISSIGPMGCGFHLSDMSGNNVIVDNEGHYYEFAGYTQAGNSDTKLVSAAISYKLRVSPAPASATFTDVPTGHPFFQFVEALARSGITAGCGGGNFCPDTPVTRGQMAVFLAAALGLHFPN